MTKDKLYYTKRILGVLFSLDPKYILRYGFSDGIKASVDILDILVQGFSAHGEYDSIIRDLVEDKLDIDLTEKTLSMFRDELQHVIIKYTIPSHSELRTELSTKNLQEKDN